MILKDSDDRKKAAPGTTVTGYFPALIRSGSSSSLVGYYPIPRNPFSLSKVMSISGFKKFAQRVGIPTPRFTYIPFWIS
jgi:hypothetical protein